MLILEKPIRSAHNFNARQLNSVRLLMHRLLTFLFFCFACAHSLQAQSWDEIVKSAKGDYWRVNTQVDKELAKNRRSPKWLSFKAQVSVRIGEYDAAAKAYKAWSLAAPNDPQMLNNYAWFLAAVPERQLRNGPKAIELAKKACESSSYRVSYQLDTLAAAHATAGDFRVAELYQREAIRLLPKDENKQSYETHLKLFQQDKVVENGFRYEGRVRVTNKTGVPFTLAATGWRNAAGEFTSSNAAWNFSANESGLLVINSKEFQASEFRYRIKNANGQTPASSGDVWVSRYVSGDTLEVIIQDSKLPKKRVVVAKPVVPAPDPDPLTNGLKTLKEVAEAAKEAKETYDKFRELIPKKKKASDTIDPKKLSADLILKSVDLAAKKKNGKKWDSWLGKSLPDIQVVVSVTRDGSTFSAESSLKQDGTYGAFNEKLIRIQEGDSLSITVYDRDLEDHDIAGKYSKTVTSAMIEEKSATWSFDQVLGFDIKFEY